jgi:hypothetical protein
MTKRNMIPDDIQRAVDELWNGRAMESALLERDEALDDLVQFAKSKRRRRDKVATSCKIDRLAEAHFNFQIMVRRFCGDRPALKVV